MPKHLPLLALALLAFAGCAKNHDPESPADSLVATFHTSSPLQAAALQNSSTSACAAAANCSASVGLFTGKQGSDLIACTAFLIGSDLAVTNAHCIPSAVKLSPPLCADRIRITLPAAPGLAEASFSCKRLEAISERPNDISPDLALIRLDRPTGRAALPIQTGVSPGETLTAFKMNPIREGATKLTGKLEVESCPAVANNYLFPIYKSALDPVFVAGCNSVPGNSGSPVVGANGVAGLLQASLRLTEAQRGAWLPYLEKTETDFAPLALGTNLRCLQNGKIDPTCTAIQPDEIERPKLSEFMQANELSVETSRLLQPYLQQATDFAWEREMLEHHSLEQIETLRPGCVRSTGGSDPAEATALVPTFKTRIYFNRYLQARARAELVGAASQSFRFSRFDMARTGEARVESSSGQSWNISACE